VPIPPELVALLREHITRSGAGSDGRLFRSQHGNPDPAVHLVARLAEGPRHRSHPGPGGHPAAAAALRSAPLRVTWRLNSGVPPTKVAAWAGHSVEVLMRIYAKCMTGLEDVWITRMNQALHLQDPARRSEHDGTPTDPE